MTRTRRPPAHDLAAGLRGGRFRWTPVVALALGVGGFALVLAEQAGIGGALLIAGMATASWLPFVGPLRIGGAIADEFDRALHARAYLAALASISFAAFLGLMVLAAFALLAGWTRETLLVGMVELALLLVLLWTAIPTLYASWAVAPLDEEE